jgi:hypothetical protein
MGDEHLAAASAPLRTRWDHMERHLIALANASEVMAEQRKVQPTMGEREGRRMGEVRPSTAAIRTHHHGVMEVKSDEA